MCLNNKAINLFNSWLFSPSPLPSYYVNGRDTSLEDFLDPEILDTLALKTNEVLEVITCGISRRMQPVQFEGCLSARFLFPVQKVKLVSPGKPVWLGETSSAYGGGAMGLSDTFAAGFM